MNDPLAWTPEELEAGIAEVIQKATGRAVEDRDANLFAMGFDSLSMLDVLALLEKRFSISLSEDVIEGFHSVSAIARIVQGARS
ncbi:MAG: acyl carrier protein [Myxococcota bacterium]|nr:acyl carrier protein [Myxococcota bacterium]